jgi:hypothetical protein
MADSFSINIKESTSILHGRAALWDALFLSKHIGKKLLPASASCRHFFCAFLFLTEFRIFVKNRLEQGAKNGIQLQYYVGFFGRREIISRDQPKQGAKKTDFLGYSRDLFRQI